MRYILGFNIEGTFHTNKTIPAGRYFVKTALLDSVTQCMVNLTRYYEINLFVCVDDKRYVNVLSYEKDKSLDQLIHYRDQLEKYEKNYREEIENYIK